VTRKHVIAGLPVILLAAAALGGYSIGLGEAASKSEAADAREAAYGSAFEESRVMSLESAAGKGEADGAREGRLRGRLAGGEAGTAEAETEVKQRQAAEAAEAAAAAEAQVASLPTIPEGLEYTDQLPNGEPGYVLPLEDRSLSCVGFDAETGQCVGD
jgi:hypothetical protein